MNNINQSSQASPQKEKKSHEDIIMSLRRELKYLYESLKDKNDQLLILEKEVRDRDISIRFLTGEFKKLKDQFNKNDLACGDDHKNNITSSGPNKISSNNNSLDKSSTIDVIHCTNDDLLIRLQRDIKERDVIIKDLNQKIMRISKNMSIIQKESNSKTDEIKKLYNEIDKFRQVVSKQQIICLIFLFIFFFVLRNLIRTEWTDVGIFY